MAWLETSPMTERQRFIDDASDRLFSMTELCARYGISRKTGYKWLDRYAEQGRAGLRDRSHAPQSTRRAGRGWSDSRFPLLGAVRGRHAQEAIEPARGRNRLYAGPTKPI
jgi:transposase-like protein